MATATVYVEFDGSWTLRALQRAIAELEDPTLLMQEIGEALLISTRERAALEIGPDGVPWAPLSPRYARRKAKLRPGVPKLVFDNRMLGRLTWQADRTQALVGTNVPYAAAQQFGRPDINLPARPWLGTDPEDRNEILRLLRKHLELALAGGGAVP